MKPVQEILSYQVYNTHKLVSLYLALLTGQSSRHIFTDHELGSQNYARYSEGHR